MNKEYLGDSVYVKGDYGQGVILTTENGYTASNIIYLDWGTYQNLVEYVDNLKLKLNQHREELAREGHFD